MFLTSLFPKAPAKGSPSRTATNFNRQTIIIVVVIIVITSHHKVPLADLVDHTFICTNVGGCEAIVTSRPSGGSSFWLLKLTCSLTRRLDPGTHVFLVITRTLRYIR